MIIIRLWHKDLIPYLDKQRLIAQWRECCCIAKNIADNGTPNHILVNKVLNYPTIHFVVYTNMVLAEMKNRGYKISEKSYLKFCENIRCANPCFDINANLLIKDNEVFPDWHNTRYLKQCLYNLEEKALCQGIPKNEWDIIYNRFKGDYDLCQIK